MDGLLTKIMHNIHCPFVLIILFNNGSLIFFINLFLYIYKYVIF